ncbi:hypothetical protein NSQ77_09315 [Oceanobacillus sp. FSL K6-2867]|uniref:hypothetical protein n=1 Tax=Oceanobacillus sp. FSL K6-2867 TaxID=2954748 RepID=UPI0030D7C894
MEIDRERGYHGVKGSILIEINRTSNAEDKIACENPERFPHATYIRIHLLTMNFN